MHCSLLFLGSAQRAVCTEIKYTHASHFKAKGRKEPEGCLGVQTDRRAHLCLCTWVMDLNWACPWLARVALACARSGRAVAGETYPRQLPHQLRPRQHGLSQFAVRVPVGRYLTGVLTDSDVTVPADSLAAAFHRLQDQRDALD